MARANPKKMRAALKEALDLHEHEYCFADGTIIVANGSVSVGAQWLMECREALGLDPITGKRTPAAECDHKFRMVGCPSCTRRILRG